MLELINISKSYEQTPLLKNISFQLNAGETIGLLGASGSGKSTLLRIIAGLESPEGGRILFNGEDLAPRPPHLRDFGLVFQDYALFPHLNVFDNVAFGLKMKNIKDEMRPRVTEMLETVNLQGFENRKVTGLSGGEQQRVALARALAIHPRLLMFDEPLGALDRTLKEDLLNELRMILHKTSIPAIYVTHDQDEAFAIADKILLLHDGEIIRAGSPSEVWQHPGSIHAARMLGIGNIITGKIESMEGGMKTVSTDLGVFRVECQHARKQGDMVPLLIRQTSGGENIEAQIQVADVIFKRDEFEVRVKNGLAFRVENAPKIGEVIRVKIQMECLE
jgi:ABC-type Fe3+/spermidine/putrescine transport system ATPase subunit